MPDNKRNSISHFPVFNEFEIGVLENTAGDRCEIFQVTFLIREPFGYPTANQDSAEQGKKDTDDLCSGKPFTGPNPKEKRMMAVRKVVT
jgi:hypothetical protein